MKTKGVVFAVPTVLLVGALGSGMASAAGCNGVVDQFKWGCAAWDNNNGPQFPHYKPPQRTKPAPPKNHVAPQPPSAGVAGQGGRMIGNDSAGAVSRSQAGIVSTGGMNNKNSSGMVNAGGLNVVPTNTGNLVGNDGASAVSRQK